MQKLIPEVSGNMQYPQFMCSSPTNQLRCEENASNLMDEDEEMEEICDDEYVETVLASESRNLGMKLQELLPNSWVVMARSDAIQYILRTREVLGFSSQTAYASVTYLDRFLSRRSVGEDKCWAVRLLAMACLSLAAKMEETTVPALPDFCLEDCNFECSVMQRMELLVLTTLEWKMSSISPFGLIHFFANKFCDGSKPPPSSIINSVSRIILSGMTDVKIMGHRASVISAAATLFVLDKALTKDALQLKISPLIKMGFLQLEDVISCYDQLLEMDIKLHKGEADDENCSSVTTSIGSAKRKRLMFNNGGVPVPEKKGKKP